MAHPSPDELIGHENVICDLDGVLADCTHRLHHILMPGRKPDWDKFDSLIHKDTLISPTAFILKQFYSGLADIVILTGRGERTRAATELWLAKHDIDFDRLLMRPLHDKRPAWEVKRDLMMDANLHCNNVICAFEDEPKTVKYMRDIGMFVYNPVDWKGHYTEITYGGPTS